jgi:hypothetical protein
MIEQGGRVVGGFAERGGAPLSGVELRLSALDCVAHWRRCGITADYLASYAAYDFEHRDIALSILSTAANELIENAVKFAADKRAPIRVALHHLGDVIRIETQNRATWRHAQALAELLDALTRGDAEELFARRIEEAAPDSSGIGLIILRKDYAAEIGARLEPAPGEQADSEFEVTVQVRLKADEIERLGKEATTA